jgi:2-polyprenyl-3-methyl-5-hydroxy-6-metoxy-1,4-benzoquinol methylase
LAFIYERPVDPDNPNSSHASILDVVGFNQRVLEVGCATGHVTKALTERGCTVVGIEVDAAAAAVAEKWAERVVVGDIDAGTPWAELEGEQFDAVTFGDVLEHLRDPLGTLRAAVRLLKPSGVVAISVPNVAHGDVRIALLLGDFPYSEVGLLDRTHIRFFTKSTLWDLVREAGLVLVETRRIVVPLFHTEVGVERESVDPSTVAQILRDPEAETYQFVVKAVLDNGAHAVATLAARVNELSEHAHDEVVRTALVHRELTQLRTELEQSQREAVANQRQLEASRHELDAIRNTKTFRIVAPFRRLYGLFRHRPPPAAP